MYSALILDIFFVTQVPFENGANPKQDYRGKTKAFTDVVVSLPFSNLETKRLV